MFSSPPWQSLRLTRVRYVVPWDWATTARRADVDAFMTAARARRQRVLVTFGAHRGCFDGRRYSRDAVCRAPGASAYRAAFRAFDDRYPWVRAYSAVERGQPRLAADVRQPGPGRPLLPRAAPREPPPALPRARRRRARHREHAPLPARVHAPRARTPAPVGTAQLPGRQPRHLRGHPEHAGHRPGRGLGDGDERDREVRREPAVQLLGVTCGARDAVDAPAGGPVRPAAPRHAVEDHAAVRLPVVRRSARRPLRRRARRPRRHAAGGLLRDPAARAAHR